MNVVTTCAQCGAPLGADALGLCPRCLVQLGVALNTPGFLTEGPGTTIGRYTLLEKIGEGGFGVVYLAEQFEPLQRKVALKIIKPGMDSREIVARFEAERQALALMDHPHIARVLDGGTTASGRPYFVMELVQGVPITEYCDRNALSTTERLQLFVRVCHAIQHAHEKGIIHRDLKPGNILVTSSDSQPAPKIIDFGVAKALGRRLTEKTLITAFQSMIGTPAYMSPEQAQMGGPEVDRRSDIYALGVLLYELLTSQTPFDTERLLGAGMDEIRRIIREEDPPSPSTRLSALGDAQQAAVASCRQSEPPKLRHRISGDLDWIVMKTLEKDRQRRYETARDLALDLGRHLKNEPVDARPPSARYRLQKLVRRNKLAFAAALAVALALLAGLALGRYFQEGKAGKMVAGASLLAGLGLASWLFVRERQIRRVAAELERERARSRTAMAAGTAPIKSVAVLPFENMGPDSEDDSMSDGIAEDLITALSPVPGLRVPARTSAFVFKGKSPDIRQIGKILNVETVLQGTVRKTGHRLRVTAQLVNTGDGFQLWTERFDRHIDDVFRIQDEIAQAIATSVTGRLTGTPAFGPEHRYQPSAEVYQLYLRARFCVAKYTPEGCFTGIRLLEQALAAEPDYPSAYVMLASAYVILCHFGHLPPKEGMPKAKAAALRALELDSTMAEAHTGLARVLYTYDWDWTGAEQEFRRALELDSNSSEALHYYGYFLWGMARYEEALAKLNRAVELDPLSVLLTMDVVWPLIGLGRYQAAAEQAEKLIAFEPSFWGGYWDRALPKMAAMMRSESMGEKEMALAREAIADLQKALALGGGAIMLGHLAGTMAFLGRTTEAEGYLAELAAQPHVTPYHWILVYTGMGDQARLTEWWHKAIDYRDPALAVWKAIADTWWSKHRDFSGLLKEIGL